MAKNLKAFMEKASQDKGLAKKVSKAKNAEELRSIMASEGFELTDSDINNVSGGLGLGTDFDFGGFTNNKIASIITNKFNQQHTANVDGEHNTVLQDGTISYGEK